MRASQSVFRMISLIGLGLWMSIAASASPISPLNVRVALDRADAVYVVEIVGVDGTVNSIDNRHPQKPDAVAHGKVLSVVKGSKAERIDVAVPQWVGGVEGPHYVRFQVGEVCLVFLSGKSSPYSLIDPQTSRLDVVKPESVLSLYTETAFDRLLWDLLYSARWGSGWTRLETVKQIGLLGDHRAASLLREISRTDDVALKSVSLAARIDVGDPPEVNELLSILEMTPENIDENQTRSGYKGTRYASQYLQRMVLDAVGRSIIPERGISRPFPASKLEGFDYATFIEKALNAPAVRRIDGARYGLAGLLGVLKDASTTQVLIGLLDDESSLVRWTASWALYEIHRGLEPAGSVDDYVKDEAKFKTYWKTWWKVHGGS